jgi:hypothetical protein
VVQLAAVAEQFDGLVWAMRMNATAVGATNYLIAQTDITSTGSHTTKLAAAY